MRRTVLIAVLTALLTGGAVARAAFQATSASSSSTFAAAAEFPPVAQAVPDLLGTAQVAVTMHATAGSYSPAASSTAISWQRCNAGGASCVATGTTSLDHTVGLADIGSTLRVRAIPSNGSTAGTAVWSEPTPVVLAINLGPILLAPVASNSPAISGAAQVGVTLSLANGTWIGLNSYAYSWRRCDATGTGCTTIAGATSNTYVPVVADRGRRLQAIVTASALGLIPNSARSAVTGVIS